MKKKHQKTLALIFARPVNARPVNARIKWKAIEALLTELGGEVEEREGSRISVTLFGQVRAYHRPHSSQDTDKGAVASVRDWIKENGVKP